MSHPAFVITLDTEPDNEWARPRVATTENARFVPRFHELCLRHGFPVTYLLTLEMAEDPFLRDYLRPRAVAGECEIGAHLHPWNTPPLEPLTDDDMRHHPYPFEYPVEVQRAKLATLVAAIERNYSTRPQSYKAGRWGLDEAHAALLEEFGFSVDTSVCPGVDWGPSKGAPGGRGGPDFTTAPLRPYRLSRDNVCRPGSLRVWELPPTIVFYHPLGRMVPGVRFLYRKIRRVRRLFDRKHAGAQWLRPYPYQTAARLRRVVELARAAGTPVLNMTLHSSELMPGCSPYNKTEASIEDLFRRLDDFLGGLRADGLEGLTLAAAAARLDAGTAAGMRHP
jgi:peptidoglycan/xylan/chitin deacetylase (PgdA/CDA1 family)